MERAQATWSRGARIVWVAGVVFVAGLIVAGMVAGRRRQRSPVRPLRLQRAAMSTFCNVTVATRDHEAGRQAVARALKRLEQVEALMSALRDDSEVSKANRLAATHPVAVSRQTAGVIQRALRFGRMTDGAFDMTVGPLIALWRRCAEADRLPTPDEIAAARARVGYQRVHLAEGGQTVRFADEGMRIDLGGIAKGYAVDVVCASLRDQGFPNALVGIGGDLYASGRRPDGEPWVVGIQDPRVGKHGPPRVVAKVRVTGKAVATSGNYRRFSEIQGRRISHILDPRTGQPVDAVPSVTIVADDCTMADALATGVSVLGPDKGLELVDRTEGVEALIILLADDRLVFRRSKGFARIEMRAPEGIAE